jgi:ATP-binding cassette subfamily C protein EexD
MQVDYSELKDGLKVCRESLIATAVFSGVANFLMLAPAFFMLNVYDKAVAFQSVPTLWVLSAVTLFLFLMLATVETVRSWMLIHISSRLDQELAPVIYDETYHNAVRLGPEHATAQPLTDFANLRQFVTGPGVIAIFDAPWLPFYLLILFLFHPMLGWLGVIAAGLFFVMAIMNQLRTTEDLQTANGMNQALGNRTQRQLRNAEAAAVMGMLPALRESWRLQQDDILTSQEKSSRSAGIFNAVIKTSRLASQSAAIAAGAYLVLQQEISPGMLIAGSILIGRALQPVEQAVGAWSGFVAAKGQYERLNQLMNNADANPSRMAMPEISGAIAAKGAALIPPGERKPIIQGINFSIPAGSVCMVVGASGSGKSTLIRGILGLWATGAGEIRIDGVEAKNYDRDQLGPQVGYLPQDIELFEGSVALNIARFGEVDSNAVIQAATDAGLHDFILSLPAGYDTMLGSTGGYLSPGQQQRVALARAIYRKPRLIVLDEPNSNLDDQGELALNEAIAISKASGSTVVIVSHRKPILSISDYIMLIGDGRQLEFGPTAEVVAKLKPKGQSQKDRPAAPSAQLPSKTTTW